MTKNEISPKEMMWIRTYKNPDDEGQLYSLFEEMVRAKQQQREIEENLVGMINRPVHKKWLHERVLDQYKHERMLTDIVKRHLDKEIELNKEMDLDLNKDKVRTRANRSGRQELDKRLEEVAENIHFISVISQSIQDFECYKMLQAILSDEYIYQSRLIRILLER